MAKKIQYNISALLLLAIILMVPAVSQAAGEEKAETKSKNSTFILTVAKPLIVTTIKPLAIIAKSAVGDAADVTYLLPANQAPHNFSLPVSALNKIAQADLVIWVGAD
ncbi:zinc ABC transporter substrate-binding protein, partial [Porticoccaceae bacterium]|nr:zinc ABC transporter substrate-binding protein [Porticoccaceae bacterium]